ncbi:MAG: triose-phosphate isomerase [Candidatus Aenigmatarchaeota archaeon]
MIMAEKPLLLVNFKTYEEGTGERGLKIARIAEKIATEKNANIAIAVQIAEIQKFSSSVSIPVYSQHMDGIHYGSNTGWILPESIKNAGATGTLLNHSEHPMKADSLREAVERAKELNIKTVVCANTPDSARQMSRLSPDYIAVEPPELIGGNISVSKAKPEVITNSIKNVNSIPLLVGAGIKNREDVRKALQLGAAGVLVSSGIMKALNPERVLKDLVEGFNV